MEHSKQYNIIELKSSFGNIVVEGPISSKELHRYHFHEGLVAFRPADLQKQALFDIANLPEGRIIIARIQDVIVGYVTFLYPDELERWSEGNMDNLIELGAIEVARPFRGASIGKHLLRVSMMDPFMENYLVITTEYYWHWDLKGTGLSVWEYRKIMEKMMNAGGLEYMATDDPEISSHPANCLMVRTGKHIRQEDLERFDKIRFKNRFMY